MSTAAGTVSVTLIDGSTGDAFARSDLSAAQLPGSFEPETTLHLGDDSWLVERAEPLTAAEAVASGRLVLTVRRIQSMPPEEIAFSLPTICGTLPAVGPAPVTTDGLELYEDDWRQVELASRHLIPVINNEMDAVRRVFEHDGQRDAEGRIFAFRKMHIRSVSSLVEPLPWSRLRGLLPAPDREYGGVRFIGSPGVAVDSFALGFGPLACYGINDQERVTVLGLTVTTDSGSIPVASFEFVLRAFDLVIVDWGRCGLIDPDRLAGYLEMIARAGGTDG